MPAAPTEFEIYNQIVTAGTRPDLGPGTAAALARGAYKGALAKAAPQWPSHPPAGWTYVWENTAAVSGYDGYALVHNPSGTLVVGNRGTEGGKSLKDWLAGIDASLFRAGEGQMTDALAFLVEAVRRADAALAPAAVKSILAVGHSLGAGLSELQASLGGRSLQNAGLAPRPIRAIGFGSAGFKLAILEYAGRYNLTLDSGAAAACVNYTRARDAVHVLQPNWSVVGSVVLCGSVYKTIYTRNGHKDPIAYYSPTADLLENHEMALYCGWWQLGADHHLYHRWRKTEYEVRPGAAANWRPRVTLPDGA